MKILPIVTTLFFALFQITQGCQFLPIGEYLRFIRVPENLPVGGEVLTVQVYPRRALTITAVDKEEDIQYFTFRDVNRTTVSVLLARPLEDLVDQDNPQNVLKFRMVCDYMDGEDSVSSYLSVTVYVEDVNDHAPVFVDAPYKLVVDELTPVGLTIFRGILALDRDKPNTPNSDVHYSIVSGNERGKFALENSHRPALQIRRLLDYDSGDREFIFTISASDRGVPSRSTNTTVKIMVTDNDDLPPKFTKGVYRTRITEFYPITGGKIHQKLKFDPPIYAFDQDLALDAAIRYDIIAGNERRLFSLNPMNATLFLEKEIDLDQERTLPGNTFVLQIQASQVDNPLKTGVARVEIEVMDLNDNLPEFEVDFYNISIVENLPNGFSVLQVIAADPDQGDNGDFIYVLDDKSGAFSLDSRTGWLTVRDQSILDREKHGTIRMRVFAKEKSPSVISNKDGSSYVSIEVTILDANDNNPTFIPTNLYYFSLYTDSKVGDIVGVVKAVDPDLGRNGIVLYDIQKTANNSRSAPFSVDPQTGKIIVSDVPLQEGRYALFVEASDQPANPSERRYSLAVITIEVISNGKKGSIDELPDFVGAPYEFWVGGNVGIGTSIGQIRVTDAVDKNGVIYDLLHSYPEGVPFAVEERSGVITVVDELSRFERPLYDFEAVVTDDQDLTLVTNVTVHVVDPLDEKGILMKGTGSAPIEFRVRENLSGVMIGQLVYKNNTSNNTNPNSGMKSLRFIIANQQDVTDDIAISQDGTLYTKRPLDRETRDVYRLTVIAQYSRGIISGAGIYQVTVYVEDENDNAPAFEHSVYEGNIPENCVSGTEVQLNNLVRATDIDSNTNAQFTLALFGEGSEMFRIDKHEGKVYFTSAISPLDREYKDVYNMKIVASDKGGLTSEAKLVIIILDENDNAPKFVQLNIFSNGGIEILEHDNTRSGLIILDEDKNNENLTESVTKRKKGNIKTPAPLLSLPEHLPVGTTIFKVIAEDKDKNDLIKYEMITETYIPGSVAVGVPNIFKYFTVHSTTGEVFTAKPLPAESEFILNISAVDSGGLRDNITIRLYINDNNDHAPVFTKSFYNFNVEEGFYHKTTLGMVEAVDDDFGPNANVSYKMLTRDGEDIPFTITEFTGNLVVQGELDRETRDKYNFKVMATDNAKESVRLSSTVDVEVNVLDVNDNAPEFYGYDEILSVIPEEAQMYSNHNLEKSFLVPVYYATVAENSPVGTPITRVFANDSDFSGNGNGLLLFDIPQVKNKENLFTVDSKDGVVTTVGKLDYEVQSVHNVTILASDLGSPSLTSTALLVVTVTDVPDENGSAEEKPVFAHRYYEIEIEENTPAPVKLLTLNVTESYKSHRLRYSLVPGDDKEISSTFKVEPVNGTIYVIQSLDREHRDRYEFKIRLDRVKLGRGMPVMVYPITSERLTGLALNEVKVIVRIVDVNDNVPKFAVNGRPIVAVIPTNANYGYLIVKLQATDPDAGLNGDIRYQILGRASDDESYRFAIDPITGQVRSITSFTRDAGRVYGFDVKATDKRGADDGKSSIANVFVYVVDERKQLVLVMGSKPTEVEKNMENIIKALQNATGYDIRVRKLEPHIDRNLVDYSATDMYLYAVDPHLNIMVDMGHLQKVLNSKMPDIEHLLPENHRVLEISSDVAERGVHSRSQRFLLSTLEVGVVVLGCVVFVGALATALCVTCIRRNKRKQQKKFAQSQTLSYAIATDPHVKATLFPTSFTEGIHYAEPTDSYLTMVPPGTRPKHTGNHHQHDRHCVRFEGRKIGRKTGVPGLETSVTSLHSSGKDSGIVDSAIDVSGRCQCGHSSSHSSDESSNSSYEDSLKSSSHRKPKAHQLHHIPSVKRNQVYPHRRNRSFPDVQESPIIRRVPVHHTQHSHIPSSSNSGIIQSHTGISRRSSERVVMTCPGTVSLSS